MKKTRFLVLALAVAVMLMGAGYAWWYETIAINSTVETGILDVDVTNVTQGLCSSGVSVVDTQFGNDTVQSLHDVSWASLKFKDLYPGASGAATVSFVNNSTMPVKLADVLLSNFDNTDENLPNTWWFNDDKAVNISVFAMENTTNLIRGTGANANKFTCPTAIEIPVGGTVTFTIKTVMDGLSNDNSTQDCDQMGFIMTPKFDQFYQ